MEVKFFTIELQLYHDEIVGRLQFENEKGELEESALHSIRELHHVIDNWQNNWLIGSFAIGTKLATDAEFRLVQKDE